ncbi:redoxin domain-containing protein [Actinotalea sp. K2]|nr:redoxin domain-containing protein [Actinotalea sp. K2]
MTRAGRTAPRRQLLALLATACLALAGCAAGDGPAAQDPPSDGATSPSAPATEGTPTPGDEAGGDTDVEPGTADPDGPLTFTATTLDGVTVDASTFAGEPVVLWFWAPWCSICRAEAPDVVDVVADLDGQVTFLGVPGLGEEDAMRSFVDDTSTGTFEHLVDADGALWQRFGVVNQPAYAFVSADGTVEVHAGALGADALRERAAQLTTG